MRFDRVALKGIGPFKNELTLDLSAIQGPLVAITGGNGEGKSTLLELLAGALFRSCPTRGSLASLAVSREAYVEVDVVNGAPHRIRHTLDNVSGKGEALVLDGQGASVLDSAKVKAFDEWAHAHLPSPEVLYASTFAAQGSGGFLEMKPGERKAVLLRVLGIEALEAKSERARDRARSAKSALEVLRGRLADERARGGDAAEARAQLEAARAQAKQADEALAAALTQAEAARVALSALEEAERAAGVVRGQRADLDRRIVAAEAKRADYVTRLANNTAILTEADAIRAAHERLAAIDARLGELREKRATAIALENTAAERQARLEAELRAANLRLSAARTRAQDAALRASDRDSLGDWLAAVPGLRADLAKAEADEKEATELVRRCQDLMLHGAERRIQGLRSSLEAIGVGCSVSQDTSIMATPARFADLEEIAYKALQNDNGLAEDAAIAPVALAGGREREQAAQDITKRYRTKLQVAEKRAARKAEIEAAEGEERRARADIASIEAEVASAHAALKELTDEAIARTTDDAPITQELNELATERKGIEPVAAKLERLTSAEARIAELDAGLKSLAAELSAMIMERDALVEPPLPAVDREALTRAGAAHAIADDASRKAHASVAVAEKVLETATEAAARIAQLTSEQRAADDDLADWTRLAEDLGRDGLQALEIDAAGPELTELVNDLLHTCFGPRWTVSIEASRQSADGKKILEGCEVRVLDTEHGREGTGETLSGGERVIVGEAISLALSMLACRRSGVRGATLVRDETGAALDPKNARAFVAMLRRAAELVGASQVLFVSHVPEIQELADARIEICDGKATVVA